MRSITASLITCRRRGEVPTPVKESAMSSIHASSFLRRVLLLDAVSCIGMGLLLIAAAGPLAAMLSLPEVLLREAGIVLLPFAVFVGYLATRASVARAAGWSGSARHLRWVGGGWGGRARQCTHTD